MTGPDRNRAPPSLRRRGLLAAATGSIVGLAGCLGESEYTISDVTQTAPDDGPIALEIDDVDPDIEITSDGRLKVTATNTSDRELELVSHGIRPFGMLELHHEGIPVGITIWTDAYEESEHVNVRSGGFGVSFEVLTTPLEPGESTSHVYEIHGGDVDRDGSYMLTGRRESEIAHYHFTDVNESLNETRLDEDDDQTEIAGYASDVELRVEADSTLPFL